MLKSRYFGQGFLAIVLSFSATVYGQSTSPTVVANAGGGGSSATHQVVWTIGEPMIATYSNASNQLTQGFHQTNLMITSVEEIEPAFSVSVFPNPTTAILSLSLGGEYANDLKWSLVDVAGRERKTGQINSAAANYQLDVQELEQGIYFLQLSTTENQILNTYKIQKL